MANRRDFIKYLGASGVTTALAAHPQARANPAGPPPSSRPHVLFVVADQWRGSAFSFGPSHDEDVQTPQLAAFAGAGMRLDRCYATKPVCSPNRSAMLTGQYPHQTGMMNNNLMVPPDIPCMSDVFTDAGYRSHYSGKWHMDGAGRGTTGSPAAGFVPKSWRRRGLQNWEGGFNRGHSYFNGSFMLDDEGTVLPVPPADPGGTLDAQLADFEPHRQVDIVNGFIADHVANHPDNPFFIWLNFGPPHTPYTPVPPPFDNYVGSALTLRPNYVGSQSVGGIAGYYGLCEALDYEFSRLLATLQTLGIADDTIVIFTSDHGDMLGSHDLTKKGKPEEESWRVPFFVRWPNRIAPAVSQAPFSSADIMPTLLSLCDLEIPDSVSGRDKSDLLCGISSAETPVFGLNDSQTNPTGGWRAVVKRIGGISYKLIRRINATSGALDTTELFDLDADPYELANLVADGGYSGIRSELETDLAHWQTDTGDTFPAINNPQAGASYPDSAASITPIASTIVHQGDGTTWMRVKSQSRVYFSLEESSDLVGWMRPGSAKHGNGNNLNFQIMEPPLLGIPRMYYRVVAEQSLVVSSTEFVEGGDIAGATASDWTNGAPDAANQGEIAPAIVNGTMGGDLDGQVITQLGGTILINSGVASDREIAGTTHYTLVDGVFRRTTPHVLRLGRNQTATDVVFSIVGGRLDLSAGAGATGLVFMGTDSVLNVSGGLVDVGGNPIALHTNSAHTDSPIIHFEEDGAGEVRCANLNFNLQSGTGAVLGGYLDFAEGSAGKLVVSGTISNDGTSGLSFEDLWNAGRLRYAGGNAGSFGDYFQVNGGELSLQ